MKTFSDETLMRYVDGELDDAEGAEIEAALAADADLAARIEMFAETRLSAQDAMRPLLTEPVPQKLRDSVESMVAAARQPSNAVDASSKSGGPPSRIPTPANDWWRLAAAACVAAVIGAGAGFLARGEGSVVEGLQVADIDRAALDTALDTVPAGEEREIGDARFRVIGSFRDVEEALCREFELDMRDKSTLLSVVCRSAGEWQVRFAVKAAGDGGGYAPASSSDALNAYLTVIEAGDPLSPEEEGQALENLR